jgi:hypothetical protein
MRIKIYLKRAGEEKKHAFRVPPTITLGDVLAEFSEKLGLSPNWRDTVWVDLRIDLDTPLGEIKIDEETVLVVNEKSPIEYIGEE